MPMSGVEGGIAVCLLLVLNLPWLQSSTSYTSYDSRAASFQAAHSLGEPGEQKTQCANKANAANAANPEVHPAAWQEVHHPILSARHLVDISTQTNNRQCEHYHLQHSPLPYRDNPEYPMGLCRRSRQNAIISEETHFKHGQRESGKAEARHNLMENRIAQSTCIVVMDPRP